MPQRNVGLTVTYVAWDTANDVGKTGDNANHTLRIIEDGSSAAPAASPSEVDATNAPGVYKVAIAAGENDCAFATLAGKSSTADVVIIPVSWTNEHNMAQISGDATAADNAELDYDGTGYAKTNSTVGTVTDVTNAVTADVTSISGDSTAADNAELFFDDTGFDASNSTIGTVTDVTNEVTADATKISGSSTAADNIEASALTMAVLTVSTANTAASTTGFATASLTSTSTNAYVGRVVVGNTSGQAMYRQLATVTASSWDSVNSETILTTSTMTAAPSNGDTLVLI